MAEDLGGLFVGVREAEVREMRRRLSRHGSAALLAMFVPAVLFPLGLALLHSDVGFGWLNPPADYPWELWAIAVCGSIGTLAGVADWQIRRSGTTVVGLREHRAHLTAFGGGGIPLFCLMAAASLSSQPLGLPDGGGLAQFPAAGPAATDSCRADSHRDPDLLRRVSFPPQVRDVRDSNASAVNDRKWVGVSGLGTLVFRPRRQQCLSLSSELAYRSRGFRC